MLLALPQKNGECSSMDILQALGLKDRSHTHKSYLQPALVAGYIEMTLFEWMPRLKTAAAGCSQLKNPLSCITTISSISKCLKST
jgi:hypothetical protein